MTLQEAVALSKEGNQAGFSYLYETTYQKNYYVAIKYLKNEETALDILQDAYVKAFQNIGQLEDADKFPQWMARIVATRSINEIKRSKPTLFSQMESDEQETDFEESFADERVEAQPELSMEQAETTRLVKEIIDGLSEEQRICITMFYIEQMSVKEIAGLLGVSENTVKSRLNYGRQKIKEEVLTLEKKGTKLYGLAPFAFFLYLLHSEESVFAASAPALSVAGAAVGTAGMATATATGGTAAAKTVAMGTIAKILIPIVSVAAVAGIGTIAYVQSQKATTEIVVAEAEAETETDVPEDTEELESETVAAEVEQTETESEIAELEAPEELFEEYVQSLTTVSDQPFSMYFVTHPEYGNLTQTGDPLEAGMLGYYICDFDLDEQDELLTIESTGEKSETNGTYQVVLNMYEAVDGELVLADSLNRGRVDTAANGQEVRWVLYPSKDNLILYHYSYEWSIWCDGYYRGFTTCRYTDGKFELLMDYESDGSFPEEDEEYAESVETMCESLNIPEDNSFDLMWAANFSDYTDDGVVMAEVTTELNYDWEELSGNAESYKDSGVPLASGYVK
jgi:RNA polymerase sigma factor (sigma-70 family)